MELYSSQLRVDCSVRASMGVINLKLLSIYFFFFFQAEDGIRDIGVTGVQTCALPISSRRSRLLSTSAPTPWRTSGELDPSSIAPTATCSAAWNVKPPANTARRRDRKSVV